MTQAEWREIVQSRNWSQIGAAFKTGLREPVTTAQLEACVLTIARAHHAACDEINKLKAELAAIRRDLEDVERYRGVWRPNKTYQRGDTVTYDGGKWFCVETTDTRPKTDDTWHLTVKSGMAPK